MRLSHCCLVSYSPQPHNCVFLVTAAVIVPPDLHVTTSSPLQVNEGSLMKPFEEFVTVMSTNNYVEPPKSESYGAAAGVKDDDADDADADADDDDDDDEEDEDDDEDEEDE